eukprot:jgi/Mesvir1/11219/Mv03067-RA.1
MPHRKGKTRVVGLRQGQGNPGQKGDLYLFPVRPAIHSEPRTRLKHQGSGADRPGDEVVVTLGEQGVPPFPSPNGNASAKTVRASADVQAGLEHAETLVGCLRPNPWTAGETLAPRGAPSPTPAVAPRNASQDNVLRRSPRSPQ